LPVLQVKRKKMAKGIYKAMNMEPGEETSVILLMLQSVFLGIFYGSFDISAHALFLNEFGPEMVPKAYIISGLAGIVMTAIYSAFQGRVRFSTFAAFNLITVAIITVLMRGGFFLTEAKWPIFLLFVMMGPLNILALLGFWGTSGRLFTLRQGKRLFGLLDTGQIVGIILASYAIPVILSFQFATVDLLYISSASILVALLFQLILSAKVSFEPKTETAEPDEKKAGGFFSMFKDRYITQMSFFVVLLVLVVFFVHYSFLSVINENYPEETELAGFLGMFNGSMMIFSVLIKTLVYGRLMKTYGLKLALVISPVLILFFIVIASIIGGFFGFAAGTAGFTFFFLIISVSKLFAKSLQDSFVAPSMKILYQSLEKRIRYAVQARIDGTINEISALVSGLILSGLVALAFIELIHFSYVLIIILAAWTWVSLRLYSGYKKSLNDSLAKFQQTDADVSVHETGEMIQDDIKKGSLSTILNGLNISRIIDLEGFKSLILELIGSKKKSIQNYSAMQIKELELNLVPGEVEKQLKQGGSNGNLLKYLKDYFNSLSGKEIKEEQFASMAKSSNSGDRKKVARAMLELKEFHELPILNTLLRDSNLSVRIAAIQVVLHWKVVETVPVLIDLLSTPVYAPAAIALHKLGEPALEGLENAFYRSGIDDLILLRVTNIMGLIGTTEAINYLLSKINHHNRKIALQALDSLRKCGYQADEINLNKILQAVRSVVAVLAWNVAAQFTIHENNMGAELEKAIQEELNSNYDQLYLLLSIGYDPKSIFHIRENLESGTSEGIGFAIELLDLFIADEAKPVLFPVLEDTNVVDKIKQLQTEFPIEILEPYDLLISMINRDPNYINTYTKACALLSLDQLEDVTSSQDLLAQMFNPDPMLSELAAWKIYRLDQSQYNSVSRRLDPGIKNRLDQLMNDLSREKGELIINRIFYLHDFGYFKGLSGNLLIDLARMLERDVIPSGEEFIMKADGMVEKVVIVEKGKSVLLMNKKEMTKLTDDQLVGLLPIYSSKNDQFVIKAEENTFIFWMSREQLNELMYDHHELAMAVYKWMNEWKTQDNKELEKELTQLV